MRAPLVQRRLPISDLNQMISHQGSSRRSPHTQDRSTQAGKVVEQCGAKRTGGERQLHGVQELSGRRQLLPQWMTMFALQLRLDARAPGEVQKFH